MKTTGCTFFDFDKASFDGVQSSIVNQLEICHNTLFYTSPNNTTLQEVNDDLCVVDSNNNFWTTVEYELKIDVEYCDIQAVLVRVANSMADVYSLSQIAHQKSYEKHYKIAETSGWMHCVQLGKKGWSVQKAIKSKTAHNTLGRNVTIQPYSRQAWEQILCDATQIQKFPVFYKDKYRFVLVNKQTGSVFGISGSKTKFLSPKYANKCEIEIEYWSNLLPKGSQHKFDQSNQAELDYIVQRTTQKLTDEKILWNFPGVRKIDWLEGLYKKQ